MINLVSSYLENCLSYCLETCQADREWWVDDLINFSKKYLYSKIFFFFSYGPLKILVFSPYYQDISMSTVYGKYPKNSNTKASDKMTYANSVDPDQTAPEGAVWSWSTLFAIPLNI